MNSEVEFHIRQNYQWAKLPATVKQSLGNSQKEYGKCIANFSIKNQLRYRGNLVRFVRKDERRYYEDLLSYSRENLMLYPYHLSDVMVKGLRVTPFQYYISMMENIMKQEKSYDSLPNFTAADCLRLLDIGRNEYIDLMYQYHSDRKLFRRKNVKDLLPPKPAGINVEPWWNTEVGCVIEEDIKLISQSEKELIDRIIDHGCQKAGDLNYNLVHSLYKKGLIYFDVPIDDDDYIVLPPLEGFVMNRVLGDYFETLLYKIFVSIDEHTSVGELANVLQIDAQAVKNAVSLYCRLGFARKKNHDSKYADLNPTWRDALNPSRKVMSATEEPLLLELNSALIEAGITPPEETSSGTEEAEPTFLSSKPHSRRIAFLFDSAITAFLMMGNLSPGLKNYAVTMFEVGKLHDESLDSFLAELEKISIADSEGETQRYFDHALILRSTILFLRHNRAMGELNLALDLIRCESLQALDPATCSRLLNKNYALLVSMASLSKEVWPISSCMPPHLGPAVPEVNTVWFKLFIYHLTGYGPPSLLLSKGTRVKKLPQIFLTYDELLVTTWGHDPGVLPVSNIVFTLNDALCHSAVLVQAYGVNRVAETCLIPFPSSGKTHFMKANGRQELDWSSHPAVRKLSENVDLVHNCGFITMVNLNISCNNDLNIVGLPPEDVTAGSIQQNKRQTSLVEACVAANTSPAGGARTSSSPVNGFTSEECADVLEQELDNLCGERSPKLERYQHVRIKDSNESDGVRNSKVDAEVGARDSKMLAADRGLKAEQDQWTLLDCCFGVPLFDAEANSQICEAILSTELCSRESLEKLTASSRRLSLRLLDFIAHNQDLRVLPEEVNETLNKRAGFPLAAMPTQCLKFSEGKLQQWDGK